MPKLPEKILFLTNYTGVVKAHSPTASEMALAGPSGSSISMSALA
jgi:hypothetical protein